MQSGCVLARQLLRRFSRPPAPVLQNYTHLYLGLYAHFSSLPQPQPIDEETGESIDPIATPEHTYAKRSRVLGALACSIMEYRKYRPMSKNRNRTCKLQRLGSGKDETLQEVNTAIVETFSRSLQRMIVMDDTPRSSDGEDVMVFNNRLQLLLSKGRPTYQSSLLAQLTELLLRCDVVPDPCTFNILIRRLTLLRCTVLAKLAFHAMLQSGVKPDSHTINALLALSVAGNDIEGFRAVKKIMRQHHFPRNVVLFGNLINAALKFGRPDMAEMYYRAMLREVPNGPSIRIMCMMLRMYTTRRDWERGLEIWKETCRLEAQGKLAVDAYTQRQMIELFKKCGFGDQIPTSMQGIPTYAELRDRGIQRLYEPFSAERIKRKHMLHDWLGHSLHLGHPGSIPLPETASKSDTPNIECNKRRDDKDDL